MSSHRVNYLAPGSCFPRACSGDISLCRACYDSVRWKGSLPTSLSAEARAMSQEAAGKVPRAGRRPESSSYIRTERPRVAEFVAGVAVKHVLDLERAVSEIKPELSPVEVAITAQKLERDPMCRERSRKPNAVSTRIRSNTLLICYGSMQSPKIQPTRNVR
jgi:hypothetical protein